MRGNQYIDRDGNILNHGDNVQLVMYDLNGVKRTKYTIDTLHI